MADADIPEPLVIAVAPTGARRNKTDHANLPIAPEELAETASACLGAGAAMLHLHVRDADSRHSLDPRLYSNAIATIRQAVGERLVIQATTEAGGRYEPPEQMDAMRALEPEAVSLAVREVLARAEDERAAGEFLQWAQKTNIAVQFILYDTDDLARFRDLKARGVVPGQRHWLLFALGRYADDGAAHPTDLLPFVDAPGQGDGPWMACAFGPREAACTQAAAALGGQVRVGFENNLQLPDGRAAQGNAALVANAARGAEAIGRPPADADTLRRLLAELG